MRQLGHERARVDTTLRRFTEFGYDVKMGQIKGLKNLSIRKIRVSKAIPRTYETYVEMLLAERIRDVPCRWWRRSPTALALPRPSRAAGGRCS